MSFRKERQMAEEALASNDSKTAEKLPFPPVAKRILYARESLGLSRTDIENRLGKDYRDLEFHNDEAFTCESVETLAKLANVLKTSLMTLLFSENPSPPLTLTTYSEVVEKLRALMTNEHMSVAQLSDKVGWELQSYLDDPNKLSELPIFGLRWICQEVDIDWATTLGNATL